MPQPLSGPGIGLQLPQQLYPANLANNEVNISTNEISLAPGEALPIAAGRYLVSLGKYCSLQYLDPVSNSWTLIRSGNNNADVYQVLSDGFNLRVANQTGCVVGASVTNGGSNWVQATTTVTPSTGNSTWQPVVGGAVNLTVSVTAVGAGYGIAPLVFFDAPASPGIQATGLATISSGTVTSITVTNQGAGYPTAPAIGIVVNPADPNIGTAITNATATCSLTGAGSITAVILTNAGAAVANTMSLTVAGAGANATVAALFLNSITGVSVTTAGTGYGTFTQITTINGQNTAAAAAWTNPAAYLTGYTPRPAMIPVTLSGTGLSTVTTITDGGLFLSTPGALPLTNGIITTITSLVFTLGGQNDTIRLQSF